MTESERPMVSKDFRALRDSGDTEGASKTIGAAICAARDVVAHGLIRCGATPNRITLAGFLLTCLGGYCLARGAGQGVPYMASAGEPVGGWPSLALLFLLLAGACDMLDGAVARVGQLSSQSGAVLDSAVDRFSDIAIFGGCFLHFALQERPNWTYQVLAVSALCNALLISYIKARAEDLIEDCSVGYWLRGERYAAVLIGCATGHVPAVLWQLAVSGGFTVWRRLTFAFFTVRAAERGTPPPARGPVTGWRGRFQLWRHPRGSIAYDFVTGAHIAYIIFAAMWIEVLRGTADPLRMWLGG